MSTHTVAIGCIMVLCLAGAGRAPAQPPADTLGRAPADVVGSEYLEVRTLLSMCPLAAAGATIHAAHAGRPLEITAASVPRIQRDLDDRLARLTAEIRRRGHARLAAGYRAQVEGGCDDWQLAEGPVLVEQEGFDLHLSSRDMRHMGVVVESSVVFRHDMNTGVLIKGRLDGDRIVFVTGDRGGVTGLADRRCTLSLAPEAIAGPDWADAFLGRALAWRSYDQYGPMLADLDRSLALVADARVAAMQACVLATCPDATIRDGRRAVAAAEKARRLSAGTTVPIVEECLALAHAEAGNFKAAVEHQRRLIELAPEEDQPPLRERLRLFEARRPYHEKPRGD